MPRIWNFVITGGPSAGKTTGLSVLEQVLTSHGYKVIIIPETATEVILSGISFKDIPTRRFQELIFKRQLNKEDTVRDVLDDFQKDVVILYDRGLMDGKAYITEKEFSNILARNNYTQNQALDRYDAVFHLITAADGAEEFYTLENNKARSESAEQARELDMATRSTWLGHRHLRIIDNSTDFNGKINKLLEQVFIAMGRPAQSSEQRKILVKKPDAILLEKLKSVHVGIEQHYLEKVGDAKRRVRARNISGEFTYFFAEISVTAEGNLVKKERKITPEEYFSLQKNSVSHLKKERYSFFSGKQYCDLDIYPNSEEAILSVTMDTNEQKIVLPEGFVIIKQDITTDPTYFNENLAHQ